jgi:hypothetical protein
MYARSIVKGAFMALCLASSARLWIFYIFASKSLDFP